METIIKDFPESAQQAWKQLLRCEYGEVSICRDRDAYRISTPPMWCLQYELKLHDASGLPENEGKAWRFDPYELKKAEQGYILTGEISSFDWEEEQEVTLRFSGTEGRTWAAAMKVSPLWKWPWHSLFGAAAELVNKSKTAPELVNEREKELLPLIQELGCLSGVMDISEKVSFPILRSRMDPKLHKYLDKMERHANSWRKFWKYADQLRNMLNRIEHYSLWRNIRDEIAVTQQEYPFEHAVSMDSIHRIQDGFHILGYSGNYPDFVKYGTVVQNRLIKSQDNYYWVRKGTRMVSHIHVTEQNIGGVSFLCGTELLRDGEESLGFDSCRFRDGGRRFLWNVEWFETEPEELDRKLNLAAKKAELRKLSRKEKGDHTILWALLALAFFCGGGIFALAMTLGLGLVAALSAFLFDGIEAVPGMLANAPWVKTFISSMTAMGVFLGLLLIWLWDEET